MSKNNEKIVLKSNKNFIGIIFIFLVIVNVIILLLFFLNIGY